MGVQRLAFASGRGLNATFGGVVATSCKTDGYDRYKSEDSFIRSVK